MTAGKTTLDGSSIDIDEMEGDEPYLPFMMDMPVS